MSEAIVRQIACLQKVVEDLKPPESSLTDYHIIRLDGNLAVAATPFVKFLGGTPGNTYTLDRPYKSFVAVWLRETAQDAEFEINDVGYRAGAVQNTARYVTILPQNVDNGGIQLHEGPLVFRAMPGAFVEIGITYP